jgi:oligoribonuclease NrnB/cAMP/cGMP phosphodiesterase (DHH superfamily)
MKIAQVSHWDLDGAGSIINVKASIPKNADYIWKASGYGKIEKMINEATFGGFDALFVTDLNYNEEQFRLLGKLKKRDNRIIYVDHHTYPKYDVKKLGEELGISVHIDRSVCGTMGTFNYLGRRATQLEELNVLIDKYDLWKKNDPDFLLRAHPLNDLFWEYSMDKFLSKFKNGYFLDSEDLEVIGMKTSERKTHLENSFKNAIINEEQKILMIMNRDTKFTNDYTLFYPEFDVYLILCRYESGDTTFQFSVRISDNVDLTIKDIDAIIARKLEFPFNFGGHEKTGGLSVPVDHLEEFMEAFNDSIYEWRTKC